MPASPLAPPRGPAPVHDLDAAWPGGLRGALAADLGQRYSSSISASSIIEVTSNEQWLPDSTRKFLCPAPASSEDAGFLIVSGPGNPQLVARNVANIAAVREQLPPALADPVLAPAATGNVCGLSYAVWPRRRALSKNRLIFALQKRALAPSLFDWLFDVARTSATAPENPDRIAAFAEPLDFILHEPRHSDPIRDAASKSLSRLWDGSWNPRSCIQHSDFWIGNVLWGPSGGRGFPRFHIIDWAGASLSGHPFFDLTRLSMSLNPSAARRAHEFARHCAVLECDADDAIGYLLCALGVLGAKLEHFPEEKYLDLCRRAFDHALASMLRD